MKLYRCVNPACPTQGDFEADAPACPACAADPKADASLVVELTPVHYLYADPAGPLKTGIGNRRVACKPLLARLPKQASGERLAVTCPACRAAAAFKAHEADGADQHVPYAEAKIARENGLPGVAQG